MDFLFHFSAIAVLPFWFAMIVFPGSKRTRKLVASPLIIVPPVLCYLALGGPHLLELIAVFSAPTPESLAVVMAEPWAASMFWAYAGAFDLFVGRWIYFDAIERGIRARFVSPPLFICIFIGPLGFALYAIVRAMHAPSGGNAATTNPG